MVGSAGLKAPSLGALTGVRAKEVPFLTLPYDCWTRTECHAVASTISKPSAHPSTLTARIVATASRPQSERRWTLSIWNARTVTSVLLLAGRSEWARAKKRSARAVRFPSLCRPFGMSAFRPVLACPFSGHELLLPCFDSLSTPGTESSGAIAQAGASSPLSHNETISKTSPNNILLRK
jgi:hypothetical protein